MNTAALNRTDQFLISIPHVDVRRFKALIKAFGWSAEKQESLNATTLCALQEMEEGHYTEFSTVDDYLKVLG